MAGTAPCRTTTYIMSRGEIVYYASFGGLVVDEPHLPTTYLHSILYKPGECEISLEVCFT
jgi:hypothetical protein